MCWLRLNVLILFVILSANSSAQDIDTLLADGQVSIRAFTEPAGQVWFAQQTRLVVELRTSTWFTEAPRYPEIHLNGAVAILPGGFATNYTEREAGVTFAVQRRIYLIYPQRVGTLAVPPIGVRFGTNVDGRSSDLLTLQTEPLQINVVMPQKAGGISQLVTTPQLRVTDRYDRDLEELETGDAITRTVTITASDSLALLLPDLKFDAPSGVTVYAAQPVLQDSTNRGRFSGERTESVTYVLEKAGDYNLPAIEIHWWNPESERLVTESLDSVEFAVVAGTAAAEPDGQQPAAAEARDWSKLQAGLGWLKEHMISVTLLLAAGYALGVAIRRYLPAYLRQRRRRRDEYRLSEEYHFRNLLRAMDGQNEDNIRSSLWSWIDCLAGIYTVSELANVSATPALLDAWQTASAARYGANDQHSGKNSRISRRDMEAARARILRNRDSSAAAGENSLNPRS